MRPPFLRSAFILAVILVVPRLASAQKLDKDDKKFLDDVRPILLADEEKTFKGLKEKGDRLELHVPDVGDAVAVSHETGGLAHAAERALHGSLPAQGV